MTPTDLSELSRFAHYIRLVDEAERAGVPRREAVDAIFEDLYPGDPALAKKALVADFISYGRKVMGVE